MKSFYRFWGSAIGAKTVIEHIHAIFSVASQWALVKRSPTDSSGHKFTVDGNSVKNQKQNYFKNSSSTLTTADSSSKRNAL
jgi:hypothetical protein